MGLFQKDSKKKTTQDDAAELERRFLDENFREELRNHGRLYFEKVIAENGALFKSDLDATVAELNDELKQHVTVQLDAAIAQANAEIKDHITREFNAQLEEYKKAMKGAQDVALQSIISSAHTLQQQHQQLSDTIKKSIEEQEASLTATFEESKVRVKTMNDAQAAASDWMSKSAQALQQQHEQLAAVLQKAVASQESLLLETFDKNMAQVIEHYLLTALGDQYDLKAQLPSIIKQMEENKQAMVDDMKL